MTDTLDHSYLRAGKCEDDAVKWAEYFCELHPQNDEGTMIGWFANAIELSHDYRTKSAPSPSSELVEAAREALCKAGPSAYLYQANWDWLNETFDLDGSGDEDAKLSESQNRALETAYLSDENIAHIIKALRLALSAQRGGE